MYRPRPVAEIQDAPDDLQQRLRDRLERLPLKGVQNPRDWAALAQAESWFARGLARKRGLGPEQQRVVAGNHYMQVSQRVLRARPDFRSERLGVNPSVPALLYPLANWLLNQQTYLKATWFRLR